MGGGETGLLLFEQAFLYRETALEKIKPTNSQTVILFQFFRCSFLTGWRFLWKATVSVHRASLREKDLGLLDYVCETILGGDVLFFLNILTQQARFAL